MGQNDDDNDGLGLSLSLFPFQLNSCPSLPFVTLWWFLVSFVYFPLLKCPVCLCLLEDWVCLSLWSGWFEWHIEEGRTAQRKTVMIAFIHSSFSKWIVLLFSLCICIWINVLFPHIWVVSSEQHSNHPTIKCVINDFLIPFETHSFQALSVKLKSARGVTRQTTLSLSSLQPEAEWLLSASSSSPSSSFISCLPAALLPFLLLRDD